jgi:hypothetical protein
MWTNEDELLRISRKLTPEYRCQLLRLAYAAEKSGRKGALDAAAIDGVPPLRSQEYSCKNNSRRSKK